MRQEQKIIIRYSTAFKQKVVTEIESGELCVNLYLIKNASYIANFRFALLIFNFFKVKIAQINPYL